MVDNLQEYRKFLTFENEGDFFYLQILMRKKDQPEVDQNAHQSVRTIKTYVVDSLEYFDEKVQEMKTLCQIFNARLYGRITPYNHKNLGLLMIKEISEKIISNQTNFKNIFDSVVGKTSPKKKVFLIDVDQEDYSEYYNHLKEIVNILAVFKTKNGWHILTEGFDTRLFNNVFPDVEIHKNNPTLLYYPA